MISTCDICRFPVGFGDFELYFIIMKCLEMFVVLNLGVIAWFGADLEKDRFGFLKNLKT